MTERKLEALPALLVAAVGAGLGALLRTKQRFGGADESGLIPAGLPATLLLAGLSLLILLVLAILCRSLSPAEAGSGGTVCRWLGGAGFLAAAVLLLLPGSALPQEEIAVLARIARILRIPAALVFAVDGVLYCLDRRGNLLLSCVPTLFLAVQLLARFQNWNSDPILLDYCYTLLFSICAMLGTYHMAGFRGSRASRSAAVFWCSAGIYFTGIVLADGGALSGALAVAAALLGCIFLLWNRPSQPQGTSASDT